MWDKRDYVLILDCGTKRRGDYKENEAQKKCEGVNIARKLRT